MLGKINSMKKLVKKVKIRKEEEEEEEIRVHFRHVGNLNDADHECVNVQEQHEQQQYSSSSGNNYVSTTPTGFLAIYVGEERSRFVVPTGHLSHPLFRMLLEKAEAEFGFEQRHGLVVPCTVPVFQQVLNAIETCHGRFDFGNMVQEFV